MRVSSRSRVQRTKLFLIKPTNYNLTKVHYKEQNDHKDESFLSAKLLTYRRTAACCVILRQSSFWYLQILHSLLHQTYKCSVIDKNMIFYQKNTLSYTFHGGVPHNGCFSKILTWIRIFSSATSGIISGPLIVTTSAQHCLSRWPFRNDFESRILKFRPASEFYFRESITGLHLVKIHREERSHCHFWEGSPPLAPLGSEVKVGWLEWLFALPVCHSRCAGATSGRMCVGLWCRLKFALYYCDNFEREICL